MFQLTHILYWYQCWFLSIDTVGCCFSGWLLTAKICLLTLWQFNSKQWTFQRDWPDNNVRRTKVVYAVADTVIWQGLASVAIPGFTINRICFFSNLLFQKMTSLPTVTRKWTVTAIGLAAIPFIIKPIDHSVDWLMESSLRKWTGNTMAGHDHKQMKIIVEAQPKAD